MRFRLDVDGESHEIDVESSAAGFLVRIDGATYRARTRPAADFVEVRVGPRKFRIRLRGNEAILDDGVHRVRLANVTDEADTEKAPRVGPGLLVNVRSSMPGRVVRIAVAPGTRVRRGETLVVLEAMKMQNEIPSPGDGVVRDVPVTEGETVTADRVVASIELHGPSAS